MLRMSLDQVANDTVTATVSKDYTGPLYLRRAQRHPPRAQEAMRVDRADKNRTGLHVVPAYMPNLV